MRLRLIDMFKNVEILMRKLNKSRGCKLKNRKGFTLTEMLAAVIILLLATEITARGIGLAQEHYADSVNRSEAQMIVSTLADFVRSEITTAGEIKLSGTSLESFLDESGRLGGRCELFLDSSDGKLLMRQKDDNEAKYYPVKGSEGSYADGLKISKFECIWNETAEAFDVEIIIEDKNSKEMAKNKFTVVPFAGRIEANNSTGG